MLDFETAQFDDRAPGEVKCARCKASISDRYYSVDADTVCQPCFERLAPPVPGSFFKALLLGIVAAALGSGLYFGIAALTGYEFGLIAIIVGVMVGLAVRAGAGSGGSVMYRLLAVALTYVAIVSTYVPQILQGMTSSLSAEAAGQVGAEPAPAAGDGPAAAGQGPEVPPLAIAIAIAFVLALFVPLVSVFHLENVLGVIILAIGLYESWKLSRPRKHVISGPFELGCGGAEQNKTPA